MEYKQLLLKVPEAAARMGISKSLAYQMVLAGELPHVRFGRAVRIPQTALESWIETHTEGAGAILASVGSRKARLGRTGMDGRGD